MLRRWVNSAYLWALVAIAVAFAVQRSVGLYFGPAFTFVPFYFAVMWVAWLGGLRPALLAMVLGYAAISYYFVSPGSFVVRGVDNLVALAVYLFLSLATGLLTESLHRARRHIEETKTRFQTMADSAPVMIWMSDTRQAASWFNRPWLEFTGQSLHEALAAGRAPLVHPDDRDSRQRTYLDAFQRRQDFRMEYRLRRHDGQYRWVLDSGVPLHDPRGHFTGYIGSAIDIQDKIEAEESLREIDRRKNEFLAMLSHELRNPLATIRYANYISTLPNIESRQKNYAETIDNQVKHLAHLIDDLLDVSRINQDKIQLQAESIDMADVIRRSVAAAQPLIEARRHRLQMQLSTEPMPLVADPTRLEQVMQNLLNNAAKYTPETGLIEVAARPVDGEVVVTVKDNGSGMAPELIPQVFELFTQAQRTLDRSEGGLGIGLTLVRRLVAMHGGTVTAHSEGLGKGSEFTVRLPLAASASKPAAERPTAERQPRGEPLRVLLVEDNVESAKTLALLLRDVGHYVQLCHDGNDALPSAKEFGPDVVLLDIGLPGMDGFHVAAQLRKVEEFKDVTIIALSGYGQQRDREQSRRSGFDSHLVKPVDFPQLASLLDRIKPRRLATQA